MPVIIWLFFVFLSGKFQFQLRRLQFQRHTCQEHHLAGVKKLVG